MKTFPYILLIVTLLASPLHALNQMTQVGLYIGEGNDNKLGSSIAMGDFDHDGRDEYIISAWGWNEDTGKTYYYDWTGDWPQVPTWTDLGDYVNNYHGLQVQNFGDLNSDGIDDLGCLDRVTLSLYRLKLYWGDTDFDTLPDWSMCSGEEDYSFAIFDSCGDMNGDGHKDFALTVIATPVSHRASIFYGGAVLDSIVDWEYMIRAAQGSGLGDVNGDGFNDLMLVDPGDYAPGKLFFGGSPMDTIPDLIFYNYSWSDQASVGDVNGDGYNDICMAMHLPDSAQVWTCVYFGGPAIDNIPDVYLLDEYGDRTTALRDISGSDVNGDGYSDIVTGDGSLIWGNVVYVYLGGPWFNPMPDALLHESSVTLWEFGKKIQAGDVDGDGDDEILVSAPYWDSDVGRVFLYTGPDEWIDYGAPVEPGDLPQTPGWYKLDQNYPNPFNASTTIHFELGKLSTVSLTVYDIHGHKVKDLISSKELLPNEYNISWSGRNHAGQPVSSGMYLLVLQVDKFREMKKMVLVR